MPCPRCQHENPSGQKFCGACGTPLTATPSGPPAPSYAEITSALSEALERETATADILHVIAGSPTDIRSVFQAMAQSAAQLCGSFDTSIFRLDGEGLRLVAHHGPILAGTIGEYSLPLDRGTVTGRSVLERRTVHVTDIHAESDEFPEGSERARRRGHRALLSVPLMREGIAIGAIGLRRTEAQPFTDRQVALLQTFADQAVIAIENVRLFKELEARNRDLTEALEQQTATSEILRVISSSPTDLEPVLEAVARTSARLCDAVDATILRVDGAILRAVAHHGSIPLTSALFRERGGLPIDRGYVTGCAVLDRRTIHVLDAQSAASEFPDGCEIARRMG
jgi:two-component system, NtrC family, sensor kinase